MGQAVMFLQSLGAIQTASMQMGEPMTSAMVSLSQLVDLDQLFNASPCAASTLSDAVPSFLVQMIMPALVVIVLGTGFAFCHVIRKGFFSSFGLINAIGEVLLEFYITITLAIFAPFQRFGHPNGYI